MIIVIILVFAGYWKIKFIVAKNIADNYLAEKYDDKMVYKSSSYVFIDTAGYYIRYASEKNPNVCFNVLINSSLFTKNISISDQYKLMLFQWGLQEEMNAAFYDQLIELGADTELWVSLHYYVNDELDIDAPIYETQKEIPYGISIYTKCTSTEKFDEFNNYVYQKGYNPQNIDFFPLTIKN